MIDRETQPKMPYVYSEGRTSEKYIREQTEDLLVLADLFGFRELIEEVGIMGSIPYAKLKIPSSEGPDPIWATLLDESEGSESYFIFDGHRFDPETIGIPSKKTYSGFEVLFEQPEERLNNLKKEYEKSVPVILLSYLQSIHQFFGLPQIENLDEIYKKQTIGSIAGFGFEAFLSGAVREGDEEIVTEILKKIAESKRNEKVKILEVGSGASFPVPPVPDFGSPWLSRTMQKTFPDKVDALATDIVTDFGSWKEEMALAIFYVSPENQLHYTRFHTKNETEIEFVHQMAKELHLDEYPDSLVIEENGVKVLTTVDPNYIFNLVRLYEDFFPHSFTKPYFGNIHSRAGADIFHNGKWYIRPLVDREMEHKLFGLKIQGSVDARVLSKTFKSKGQFDFIIARHVPDTLINAKDMADWASLLKPGGKILFSGDRPAIFPIDIV